MEHQAHLLLQGHLGDEVGYAFLHWLAPVFVDVEAAVLVKILELIFAH